MHFEARCCDEGGSTLVLIPIRLSLATPRLPAGIMYETRRGSKQSLVAGDRAEREIFPNSYFRGNTQPFFSQLWVTAS